MRKKSGYPTSVSEKKICIQQYLATRTVLLWEEIKTFNALNLCNGCNQDEIRESYGRFNNSMEVKRFYTLFPWATAIQQLLCHHHTNIRVVIQCETKYEWTTTNFTFNRKVVFQKKISTLNTNGHNTSTWWSRLRKGYRFYSNSSPSLYIAKNPHIL